MSIRSPRMKKIKLFSVAATLSLSVLCHYSLAADTNTPPAKFFSVGDDGVVAPGRFPYHEGITITNAINMAGGFGQWARKDKVEIVRTGLLTNIEVNVSEIEKGKAADVKIQPDDYVRVRAGSVVRRR